MPESLQAREDQSQPTASGDVTANQFAVHPDTLSADPKKLRLCFGEIGKSLANQILDGLLLVSI